MTVSQSLCCSGLVNSTAYLGSLGDPFCRLDTLLSGVFDSGRNPNLQSGDGSRTIELWLLQSDVSYVSQCDVVPSIARAGSDQQVERDIPDILIQRHPN